MSKEPFKIDYNDPLFDAQVTAIVSNGIADKIEYPTSIESYLSNGYPVVVAKVHFTSTRGIRIFSYTIDIMDYEPNNMVEDIKSDINKMRTSLDVWVKLQGI